MVIYSKGRKSIRWNKNNLEKQDQLKITSNRLLVDKSWLWSDEINHQNHQERTQTRTNSSVQTGETQKTKNRATQTLKRTSVKENN